MFTEADYVTGIKVAAYCLVIVTSLLGNCLVIAVVYKNYNHHMRTPNNFFVVNTAVADLLITISSTTEALVSLAFSRWLLQGTLGHLMCKLQSLTMGFSAVVTTQSLSTMAVDRFIVVFFPLRRIITRRVAYISIVVIWITSVAFSLPLVFLAEVLDVQGTHICYLSYHATKLVREYFLAMFGIFKCTPLILQAVLYTAVVFNLWLRETPGNELNIPNHHHYHTERMNRRVIAMVIAIVLLFAICWLPLWIANMLCFENFSNSICRSDEIFFAVWFLAYSKSALNPCIYFIFNETFRHGAQVLWTKIVNRYSLSNCKLSIRRSNRVGALNRGASERSAPVNTSLV